jgi:hypothetical protein
METVNLESAIKLYKRHLEYVKKYQKENPELMSIKAKRYYENKKTVNPEAYKKMLEHKKEQYKLKKLKKNTLEILQ